MNGFITPSPDIGESTEEVVKQEVLCSDSFVDGLPLIHCQ